MPNPNAIVDQLALMMGKVPTKGKRDKKADKEKGRKERDHRKRGRDDCQDSGSADGGDFSPGTRHHRQHPREHRRGRESDVSEVQRRDSRSRYRGSRRSGGAAAADDHEELSRRRRRVKLDDADF